MKVKTIKYVSASEVFEGCGDAWEAFSECEPACSWGDNHASLVTSDFIVSVIDGCGAAKGQATVVGRLKLLSPEVLVDLES